MKFQAFLKDASELMHEETKTGSVQPSIAALHPTDPFSEAIHRAHMFQSNAKKHSSQSISLSAAYSSVHANWNAVSLHRKAAK